LNKYGLHNLKQVKPTKKVHESVIIESKKACGTRTDAYIKIPNKMKLLIRLNLPPHNAGEESTVHQIKGKRTRASQ